MPSTHHSFDIYLAKDFGIECAILIHHFQHWVNHNKASGKNFIDGRTWTFQTRQEIADWFPYLSEHQARRYTDKLVEKGILMKANYNKKANDDTIWYAFVNEELYTSPRSDRSAGKSASPKVVSDGKSASRVGKSANPLPDTKQDTSTLTGTIRGEPSAAPPAKGKTKTFAPKINRAEHVRTSNDEHNRLTADYGDDIILRAYENLSEWKSRQTLSKQRIDDNRAMRKWAIRSVIDEDLKSKETALKQQELKQREERIKRIASESKGTSQPRRPSQIADADKCDGKSSVPTHRILRSTNNRGEA